MRMLIGVKLHMLIIKVQSPSIDEECGKRFERDKALQTMAGESLFLLHTIHVIICGPNFSR